MGASRSRLSRLVMAEALLVNAAGGACGIALAALCVVPFHTLIKNALGLPFLLPGAGAFAALVAGAFALSAACGCLASAHAAHNIARIDTGVILREGN